MASELTKCERAIAVACTLCLLGCTGDHSGKGGPQGGAGQTQGGQQGQTNDVELWRKLASLHPAQMASVDDFAPSIVHHASKVLPIAGELARDYSACIYRVNSASNARLGLFAPPSLVCVRDDNSGFAVYHSFEWSREEDTHVAMLQWDGSLHYSTVKIPVPRGYFFAGEVELQGNRLKLVLESDTGERQTTRVYDVVDHRVVGG